jgi:hypothetical protein
LCVLIEGGDDSFISGGTEFVHVQVAYIHISHLKVEY